TVRLSTSRSAMSVLGPFLSLGAGFEVLMGSGVAALSPFQPRIESVPEPVPEQVDRDDRREDRQAWKSHHPRRSLKEFPGGAEHGPPFGRRGLRTEAEKAEGRGLQECIGNTERRLHDERGKAVG